jgi:hypothetical protein
MERKICNCCEVEKDLSEFDFHTRSKGTHRPKCKECYNAVRKTQYWNNHEKRKIASKECYDRNSDKRKEESREYRKNNPEKIKSWRKQKKQDFEEFKSTCFCSECGENNPACLDFHHVDPTTKKNLISQIWTCSKVLQEELEKCIVLCANCHRKHHKRK